MARTGSNTFRAQHVLGAVTTFAISTAVLGLALASPSMAAPKPECAHLIWPHLGG